MKKKETKKKKVSEKTQKKERLGAVAFWDEMLSSNIMKNTSDYGIRRKRNFSVDMVGTYSGEDKVSFLYSIDGYPNQLQVSYRTALRDKCVGDTKMSFVSSFEKHQIPWASPQMRARLKTWKILENESVELDQFNMYDNLASSDSQEWRNESLVYLSEAEIRRKRKTFKFRSLMLVSGTRGQDFDDTIKEVTNLCKLLNIKLSRVTGDIPEYLETFSPCSLGYNDRVIKQCGSNVITDELLARFNTFAQGTVGKEGIYWGTDIFSSFPCLKPIKRTSETAENWLITAETGGGKSYFVKGLLLQLLGNKYINGTIMDIEGFEYLPILEYVDLEEETLVLNMAEGTGSYFDPVEIILTGDPGLDKDMYSLSTSFTISLFKTLLGTTSTTDEWVDIVINDAVSLVYAEAGVTDDIETWENSEGLSLYDVYNKLKSLLVSTASSEDGRQVSQSFNKSAYSLQESSTSQIETQNDVNRLVTSNEGYQEALEMALAKVSRYFEPNGTRAGLFQNKVSVESIKDAKLVVCSFGMAGKSAQTTDPIQMALMQLCAANISHLRSIFSKYNGKYNFKVWEEFQRWGNFPDSEKTIATTLTGGRKLGDINIILTNNVAEVLDNDRFSIFTNITTVAIGCIWDSNVRSELCKRLTIPEMLEPLDLLVTQNKDMSAYSDGDTLQSNPYSKAFLLGLDKTVYTLARMSLPNDLASSDIFRTGITKKE